MIINRKLYVTMYNKLKSCVLNWIAYDMTKIYTCIVQDSQKQNIVVQTPFRISSK